jgi:predicted RNA-binding protein (virulence factor B family)
MVKVGEYNLLKVIRAVDFGVYLDDGKEGVLLPKRFVPQGLKVGDELNVFLYHDGEDRLIATTQQPLGMLGDIVKLRAVTVTQQGAFLDWGLMKDIFVPKSKQLAGMRSGGDYLVKIYLDEQTGRLAATEKLESFLSNENLAVKELEIVDLIVYRRTDIGYVCIINNRHTGVLHFNEIYRNIQVGDKFKGFIKKISTTENKIDLAAGKSGYTRVEDETEKVLRLLKENDGYLPYNDKSSPEEIYDFLR